MLTIQSLLQAIGVIMLLMVALNLMLAWKLFSWINKHHPEFLPNPNGTPFDISNIGFLFLIMLPQRGAVKLFPEKRTTIYILRTIFVISSIIFLSLIVFISAATAH